MIMGVLQFDQSMRHKISNKIDYLRQIDQKWTLFLSPKHRHLIIIISYPFFPLTDYNNISDYRTSLLTHEKLYYAMSSICIDRIKYY